MNEQAHALFTKVFQSLTSRSADVHTFRKIITLGTPAALEVIAQENAEWAQRLLTDPEYDSWFRDKANFSEATGGEEGLAAKLTQSQFSDFRVSVDGRVCQLVEKG